MTMQGIPCIYYGTEQGLDGSGDKREYVREALWGQSNAFDPHHGLYQTIRELTDLRAQQPSLRYGRQYFRACSGNGKNFNYSPYLGGIVAFSRILNNGELLVVANTNTDQSTTVHVVVDRNLNPEAKQWNVLYSTKQQFAIPKPTTTCGDFRTLKATLSPMEAQVLG
jgi:glycosidase